MQGRHGHDELDVLGALDGHLHFAIVLDHAHYGRERLTALAQYELAVLHANAHVHTSAAAPLIQQQQQQQQH